ncbi:hypothetical protein P7C70_g5303, partial [Phenoliferia sp. Uapishka_3]
MSMSSTLTPRQVNETWLAAAVKRQQLGIGPGLARLVSIAVWQGTMAKEVVSKVFAIHLPIWLFVACGFDHVIANMLFIPLALMLHSPLGVGYYIWKSMIPSFIGNVLGAVIMVIPLLYVHGADDPVANDVESNTGTVQDEVNTVVTFIGVLPQLGSQVVVADAEGAKAVFLNKRQFGKPIEDYGVLKFFGPNVVVTEGEEWRRHRRLTGPSFSERNNEMVWNDSCRIVDEWFARLDARVDSHGNSLDVDTVQTTLRLALMIISAAGFGQRHSWPESDDSLDPPPPGRKLGFITALKGSLDGTICKLMLPNWAYKLPFKYPRQVALCFSELEGFLKDMVHERKVAKSRGVDQNDLFSALLDGVSDEEGAGVLTMEELLGNMYIFLLAGHETTAHTLAFAFTLLALYPEHQTTLFEEANEVYGGRASTYDDYGQLVYTLATVQEALRMYTPVLFIPKVALEDTTIPAHTATPGEEPVATEVFIPKGSRVAILSPALHYNRVPFAGGTRACLGQKFALVESVAIISQVCLNYTIHIPPAQVEEYRTRPGESQRVRRERIFKPTSGITLTPKSLPLIFRRRPAA